jgi:hypothetical protein
VLLSLPSMLLSITPMLSVRCSSVTCILSVTSAVCSIFYALCRMLYDVCCMLTMSLNILLYADGLSYFLSFSYALRAYVLSYAHTRVLEETEEVGGM